jgi:hypothetical protein
MLGVRGEVYAYLTMSGRIVTSSGHAAEAIPNQVGETIFKQ